MSRLTKNRKLALEKLDKDKPYTINEASGLVKEMTTTKFDASIDIDVRLGVDPRKANQMVRGVVTLPHGTGKEIKVLVLCTPEKEDEAKEAGAKIMSTGRSDFPNQVNNSLGFPGIFRGALDVSARTITDEMCIAAAVELARCAEDKGLREDYIIPTMDEWEVFPREAVACALESMKEGVARVKLSKQELWDRAVRIIKNARESTNLLMKKGLISPPPKDV